MSSTLRRAVFVLRIPANTRTIEAFEGSALTEYYDLRYVDVGFCIGAFVLFSGRLEGYARSR